MFDREPVTSVGIRLASAEEIRRNSHGEVKLPNTIEYPSLRPVQDGLFCQRIFGPLNDWHCACGKYAGKKHEGRICDRCGVAITDRRVRGQWMGHVELAAPVVHIWFLRAAPRPLAALLNMTTRTLEQIAYYRQFLVLHPGCTPLAKHQLLTPAEYAQAKAEYGDGAFQAESGAGPIRKLLMELDLDALSRELQEEMRQTTSRLKKEVLAKRLRVVNCFQTSGNRPEWMVMDVLPVVPPDLRPYVILPSGKVTRDDLNDLYSRLVRQNRRVRELAGHQAPQPILESQKRKLQLAVDNLLDNSRSQSPARDRKKRPLKSLTDRIKGKEGRFRQTLLGKRVDYSARSVIVVDPMLKLHQCGLPENIVLTLYERFIIGKLREMGHSDFVDDAEKELKRQRREPWELLRIIIQASPSLVDRALLESIIRDYPVLLNRAPTLHRMGIQAFEPVLVKDNAIHLHPLVCKGFNADFDGDQMAVHLPLSIEAQAEARTLMMSTNNIFGPASGKVILSPSQDIVMGCYYATMDLAEAERQTMTFSNMQEAGLAHALGIIGLQERIRLRLPRHRRLKTDDDSGKHGPLIETTYGRAMFNSVLPEGLDYYNEQMGARELARVITDCYQRLGHSATIAMLDDLKEFGFKQSTLSGLSISTDDLLIPRSKRQRIAAAEAQIRELNDRYDRDEITEQERYNAAIETWLHASDVVKADMLEEMKSDDHGGKGYVNPVFLMAHSGARGGLEQIRQLAGMRGLMTKPTGDTIESPIKANFREGLSVLEYFNSAHGARKGTADSALKTREAGHLTRKLVNAAQDVVVTVHDCGTTQGIMKAAVCPAQRTKADQARLAAVIKGRVSRTNIFDPISGELIVSENEMITAEIARKIEQLGLDKIEVRSTMTCEAPLGVCRLCYGMDMATGLLVKEGMAVGVIAAQSIGEPGTQLTMRTFHTGGAITSGKDITCGLPGVSETFEARKPKHPAVLAEVDGVVEVMREKHRGKRVIVVRTECGLEIKHLVPHGSGDFRVQSGDVVKAGDALVGDTRWPCDILRVCGEVAVRQHLLEEVQKIYCDQNVDIDDKHIEIIVAQMLRKVRVETPGDTGLAQGALVDKFEFRIRNGQLAASVKVTDAGDSGFTEGDVVGRQVVEEENMQLVTNSQRPAQFSSLVLGAARPQLLGISKAAGENHSFLAAASFENTVTVLADAALRGARDTCSPLIVSVISGQLMPVGTGWEAKATDR